jgi:hypothetical protein
MDVYQTMFSFHKTILFVVIIFNKKDLYKQNISETDNHIFNII